MRFFIALSVILLLLFFIHFGWFMVHIPMDWRQLTPAMHSVHFTKPILVIESDDWGWNTGDANSIAKSYRKAGYEIPSYAEQSLLETPEEVRSMVDMLARHKDSRGKPAVLTANMVLANIDFEAVRENKLSEVVLIPLDSNSPRNPVSKRLLSEYIKGMESGTFWPQLHGLCHINKDAWLKGIRNNEPLAAKAFLLNSPPLGYAGEDVAQYNGVYSDFSVTPSVPQKYEDQIKDINEASAIFYRIFKFYPKSEIAPFYVWDDNTEEAFFSTGIRYIQGANTQIYGRGRNGNLLQQSHDFGQRSKRGLLYLTRDLTFEPQKSKKSPVALLKWKIRAIFSVGRPAVIVSHRTNYVGINAEKNRKQLNEILDYVEQKFPSVLYMGSDELGGIIDRSDTNLIVKKYSLKNYFLTGEDILIRLPGVWYPVLLVGSSAVSLILVYRRLKSHRKTRANKMLASDINKQDDKK
jgi:hypothetical protein